MPKLILRRDRAWIDKWRRYSIWLDRKQVAHIKQGETVRLPIAPGEHVLQARIDWCRTKELPLTVGGNDITFEIESGLRGWRLLLFWLYVFLPRRWIIIKDGT